MTTGAGYVHPFDPFATLMGRRLLLASSYVSHDFQQGLPVLHEIEDCVDSLVVSRCQAMRDEVKDLRLQVKSIVALAGSHRLVSTL